jgi:hypothetical protein
MAIDLPSSTSPIGDSDQDSTSTPDNKGKDQQKDEIKPQQRKPPIKWLGLTKSKWREIATILLLIPWVWNDIIDSHSFLRLCLLGLSLAMAQGVACSFFKNKSIALSVWLLSLIPVAGVVWENSRPEPQPHFKFSVFKDDDFDDRIEFKNEFSFGLGDFSGIRTALCVPVQKGQSNMDLAISFQHDSSVAAEESVLVVVATSNLNCIPDDEMIVPDDRWRTNFDQQVFTSNLPLQSWMLSSHNIFPYDGGVTPNLRLKILPPNEWGVFTVGVRSKESPLQCLNFFVIFSQNLISNKLAVVLVSTNFSGQQVAALPLINELNHINK